MFESLSVLLDLIPATAIILSIGVAYGMLKVKSQTTSARLDELEKEALGMDQAMQLRVDNIARDLSVHKHDTTDRLARIETKLDILLQTKAQGG
jgi:hypothetical protein